MTVKKPCGFPSSPSPNHSSHGSGGGAERSGAWARTQDQVADPGFDPLQVNTPS